MKPFHTLKKSILALGVLLLLLWGSHQINWQWDLTQDKRYSLSDPFKIQLQNLDNELTIDIFLSGNLPPQYLRLRSELNTLLNVAKSETNNMRFQFINRFEGDLKMTQVVEEMIEFGLTPETVFENTMTSVNESVIFPWAMVNYGQRSVRVPLLQKNLGDSEDEKIRRSIQLLEYKIMDGIYRATLKEKKNIAVLTSHGTSEEVKLADLLQSLSPYYNLAAFDLQANGVSSEKSLENLSRFDMLLISNPQKPFSNEEKFIIDQYTMKGGKSLWLLNSMKISRDSLYNTAGKAYGFPNALQLDDLLFKYGVRLQQELVRDVYCAPIVIAQGTQNNSNYIPFPWIYYPLPKPEQKSTIGKDVGSVLFQFAAPIDTLSNALKKEIFMYSSAFTKTQGMPALVVLQQATQPIDPTDFKGESVPLGVALEGTFNSLYANRIQPFKTARLRVNGNSKMIVIGDGNFAENQTEKGRPLTLGFDKWTRNFYANKDLLMNSIHWLTDNLDFIELRKKTVELPLLAPDKIKESGFFWKVFMILIPLLLSFFLWAMYHLLTVRKYYS